MLTVSLTFLSYLVFVNAEAISENIGGGAVATAAKTSLVQVSFEERMKHVRGSLFSVNETIMRSFDKFVGSQIQKLSVELIESVSWQGTHLKVNDKNIYVGSGGTKYVNGWLIRHRGNIESPNGTIYSNIDSFYVGPDTECGLADHYECINGSLHWLYCNATDYGVVEECDACGNNECIRKGTFARWETIREYKEKNSGSKPQAEGLPAMREENKSFATAVSGISE